TSVNELYLKITDIKDYYVNEVVFDAAARLAKEGYDNAKAAADAEFESVCAIIKADAANIMAQAQAAFNALAAKIATITADTTSAELDAIFTEALNRRAPLASSRNRLLMYLQTANSNTAVTLRTDFNSADALLVQADGMIFELITKRATMQAAKLTIDSKDQYVTEAQAAANAASIVFNVVAANAANYRDMNADLAIASLQADLNTLRTHRNTTFLDLDEMSKLKETANEEGVKKMAVMAQVIDLARKEIDTEIDFVTNLLKEAEIRSTIIGTPYERAQALYAGLNALTWNAADRADMAVKRNTLVIGLDTLLRYFDETVADREAINVMINTIQTKLDGPLAADIDAKIVAEANAIEDVIVAQGVALKNGAVAMTYTTWAAASSALQSAERALYEMDMMTAKASNYVTGELQDERSALAALVSTIEDYMSSYAKQESEAYYDIKMATYQALKAIEDSKKADFDEAALSAAADKLYGEFIYLEHAAEEVYARAEEESSRSNAALVEAEREFSQLKDLYKSAQKTKAKLDQYSKIIDSSEEMAKLYVGKDFVDIKTKPLYDRIITIEEDMAEEDLAVLLLTLSTRSFNAVAGYLEQTSGWLRELNSAEENLNIFKQFAPADPADPITVRIDTSLAKIAALKPVLEAFIGDPATAGTAENVYINRIKFEAVGQADAVVKEIVGVQGSLINTYIKDIEAEDFSGYKLAGTLAALEVFMAKAEGYLARLKDIEEETMDAILRLEEMKGDVSESSISGIIDADITILQNALVTIEAKKRDLLDPDTGIITALDNQKLVVSARELYSDSVVISGAAQIAKTEKLVEIRAHMAAATAADYTTAKKMYEDMRMSMENSSSTLDSIIKEMEAAKSGIAGSGANASYQKEQITLLMSNVYQLRESVNARVEETRLDNLTAADFSSWPAGDPLLELLGDMIGIDEPITQTDWINIKTGAETKYAILIEMIDASYATAEGAVITADTTSNYSVNRASLESAIAVIDVLLDECNTTYKDILPLIASAGLSDIYVAYPAGYAGGLPLSDQAKALNSGVSMGSDIMGDALSMMTGGEGIMSDLYELKKDAEEKLAAISAAELDASIQTLRKDFKEQYDRKMADIAGLIAVIDFDNKSYQENRVVLANIKQTVNDLFSYSKDKLDNIDTAIIDAQRIRGTVSDTALASIIDGAITSMRIAKASVETAMVTGIAANATFAERQDNELTAHYLFEQVSDNLNKIQEYKVRMTTYTESTAMERAYEACQALRDGSSRIRSELVELGGINDQAYSYIADVDTLMAAMTPDVIALGATYAAERLSEISAGEGSYSQQALITDPRYSKELAQTLDSLAKQARYAVNQAEAISLSDPDNITMKEQVKLLLKTVRDIENVASLFADVATVTENAERVKELQGAIESANTLRQEIVAEMQKGATAAKQKALLRAYEVAEEEIADKQNSVKSSAQLASEAVYHAMNIASAMNLYIITDVEHGTKSGSILTNSTGSTGFDLDKIILAVKELADEALVQAGSIMDISVSSTATPESAEQTCNEVKAMYINERANLDDAWKEYSDYLTRTEEGLDEVGDYWIARSKYEKAEMAYEMALYNRENWVSELDPAYADIMYDKQQARINADASKTVLATVKQYFESNEDLLETAWGDYSEKLADLDDLAETIRIARIDYQKLEGAYDNAKNNVNIWSSKKDGIEKNLTSLQDALNKLMAFERNVRKAYEDTLQGQTMCNSYESNIPEYRKNLPLDLTMWSGLTDDLTDMTIRQRKRLNGQKLGDIAYDLLQLKNEVYDRALALQAEINNGQKNLAKVKGELLYYQAISDETKNKMKEAQSALDNKTQAYNDKEYDTALAKSNVDRKLSMYSAAFKQYDNARTTWWQNERVAYQLEARTVQDNTRSLRTNNVVQAESNMNNSQAAYLRCKAISDLTQMAEDIALTAEAFAAYSGDKITWEAAKDALSDYFEESDIASGVDAKREALYSIGQIVTEVQYGSEQAKKEWELALDMSAKTRTAYVKAIDEVVRAVETYNTKENAKEQTKNADEALAYLTDQTKSTMTKVAGHADFIEERALIMKTAAKEIGKIAEEEKFATYQSALPADSDIDAESYTDSNHNGVHDGTEPFIDTNNNGKWDDFRNTKIYYNAMQQSKYVVDAKEEQVLSLRNQYVTSYEATLLKEKQVAQIWISMQRAKIDYDAAKTRYGASSYQATQAKALYDNTVSAYDLLTSQSVDKPGELKVLQDQTKDIFNQYKDIMTSIWDVSASGTSYNTSGFKSDLLDKTARMLASFEPDYSRGSYYTDEEKKALEEERYLLWTRTLFYKYQYEELKQAENTIEAMDSMIRNHKDELEATLVRLESDIDEAYQEQMEARTEMLEANSEKEALEKALARAKMPTTGAELKDSLTKIAIDDQPVLDKVNAVTVTTGMTSDEFAAAVRATITDGGILSRLNSYIDSIDDYPDLAAELEMKKVMVLAEYTTAKNTVDAAAEKIRALKELYYAPAADATGASVGEKVLAFDSTYLELLKTTLAEVAPQLEDTSALKAGMLNDQTALSSYLFDKTKHYDDSVMSLIYQIDEKIKNLEDKIWEIAGGKVGDEAMRQELDKIDNELKGASGLIGPNSILKSVGNDVAKVVNDAKDNLAAIYSTDCPAGTDEQKAAWYVEHESKIAIAKAIYEHAVEFQERMNGLTDVAKAMGDTAMSLIDQARAYFSIGAQNSESFVDKAMSASNQIAALRRQVSEARHEYNQNLENTEALAKSLIHYYIEYTRSYSLLREAEARSSHQPIGSLISSSYTTLTGLVTKSGNTLTLKEIPLMAMSDMGYGYDDYKKAYGLWAGLTSTIGSTNGKWYNGVACKETISSMKAWESKRSEDKWIRLKEETQHALDKIDEAQELKGQIEQKIKFAERELLAVESQWYIASEIASASAKQANSNPSNLFFARQAYLDSLEMRRIDSQYVYLEDRKYALEDELRAILGEIGYQGKKGGLGIAEGEGATGLYAEYYKAVGAEQYHNLLRIQDEIEWVPHNPLANDNYVTGNPWISGEHQQMEGRHTQILMDNGRIVGRVVTRAETDFYGQAAPVTKVIKEGNIFIWKRMPQTSGEYTTEAEEEFTEWQAGEYDLVADNPNSITLTRKAETIESEIAPRLIAIRDGGDWIGDVILTGTRITDDTLPEGYTISSDYTTNYGMVSINRSFTTEMGTHTIEVRDGEDRIGTVVLFNGDIQDERLQDGYSASMDSGMLKITRASDNVTFDQSLGKQTIVIEDDGAIKDAAGNRIRRQIGYVTVENGNVIAYKLKNGYVDPVMENGKVKVTHTTDISFMLPKYNVAISKKVVDNGKEVDKVYGYVTIQGKNIVAYDLPDTFMSGEPPAPTITLNESGTTASVTIKRSAEVIKLATDDHLPKKSVNGQADAALQDAALAKAVASKAKGASSFDMYGAQDFATGTQDLEALHLSVLNRTYTLYNSVARLRNVVNDLSSRGEQYAYASAQASLSRQITTGVLNSINGSTLAAAIGLGATDAETISGLVERAETFTFLQNKMADKVRDDKSLEYNSSVLSLMARLSALARESYKFAETVQATTAGGGAAGLNLQVQLAQADNNLALLIKKISFMEDAYQTRLEVEKYSRDAYDEYTEDDYTKRRYYNGIADALEKDLLNQRLRLSNELYMLLARLVGEAIAQNILNLEQVDAVDKVKQMIGAIAPSDDPLARYHKLVNMVQEYKARMVAKEETMNSLKAAFEALQTELTNMRLSGTATEAEIYSKTREVMDAEDKYRNSELAYKQASLVASEKVGELETAKSDVEYLLQEIDALRKNIKTTEANALEARTKAIGAETLTKAQADEAARLKKNLDDATAERKKYESDWLATLKSMSDSLGNINNTNAAMAKAFGVFGKQIQEYLLGAARDRMIALGNEAGEITSVMESTAGAPIIGTLADPYVIGMDLMVFDQLTLRLRDIKEEADVFNKMTSQFAGLNEAAGSVLNIGQLYGSITANCSMIFDQALMAADQPEFRLIVEASDVVDADTQTDPLKITEAKGIVADIATGILETRTVVPDDTAANVDGVSSPTPHANILTRGIDDSQAIVDIIGDMVEMSHPMYQRAAKLVDVSEAYDSLDGSAQALIAVANTFLTEAKSDTSAIMAELYDEITLPFGKYDVTNNAVYEYAATISAAGYQFTNLISSLDIDLYTGDALKAAIIDDPSVGTELRTLLNGANTSGTGQEYVDAVLTGIDPLAGIFRKKSGLEKKKADNAFVISGALFGDTPRPGSLSKTVVYRHGMLIEETTFGGRKGQEKVLLRKSFYPSNNEIKDITTYTYDEFGVMRIEETYYRDSYLLKNVRYYSDDGNVIQYKGREKATEAQEFDTDGATLMADTKYLYDTAKTLGLTETRTLIYDQADVGSARSLTQVVYEPREEGTGKILMMNAYDNVSPSVTFTNVSAVGFDSAANGRITGKNIYHYDAKVNGTYDAAFDIDKDDAGTVDQTADQEDLDYIESIAYKYRGASPIEQKSYEIYSGGKGLEKIIATKGFRTGAGTSQLESTGSKSYSAIIDSLRYAYEKNAITDTISSISSYTGFEGEEEVVTVKGYITNAQGEEELDVVSKYYYSEDGRLLTRIVDKYAHYGSALYATRPVVRSRYDYKGPRGKERVASETDENSIVHYYYYYQDPEPDPNKNKGLLTVITTRSDEFGDVLPDFSAGVLSEELMDNVYGNPNYVATSDGTTIVTDQEGVTIAVVDKFGTVTRYDYKLDQYGEILRDKRGRVVETILTLPDGSKIVQGPDGFKTKMEDRTRLD
ncbi:MAG: hypothetical protein WCT15_01200, partial [Candidatus Omnitrophota bacterium]